MKPIAVCGVCGRPPACRCDADWRAALRGNVGAIMRTHARLRSAASRARVYL